MKVKIFTDGACSENPGPGGWAVVFNLETEIKIVSGFELETTNNRMELLAVRNALILAIRKGFEEIEINSDSSYVINAINNNWLMVWVNKGWKNAKGENVKNRDLWEKILELIKTEGIKVKFLKVKGHSGNMFNELADRRAKEEVLKAKMLKNSG